MEEYEENLNGEIQKKKDLENEKKQTVQETSKKEKVKTDEDKTEESNKTSESDSIEEKEPTVELNKTNEGKEVNVETENGTKSKKKNKEKKKKTFIITASIIFLIILICTTGFAILNIKNTNMISGIIIEGIEIQGLNKKEAEEKIQKEIDLKNAQAINLKAGEYEYSLELNQIELLYNIEKALDEAYSFGRNKNIFVNNYEIIYAMLFGKKIDLQMTYNEELLNSIINDISVKIPNAVVENSYYIDENKLIITKGKAGNTINKTKTKEMILEKLKYNNGEIIKLEIEHSKPSKIDIQKIHDEIHTEPKDAYYTKEPFQVFSHVDGMDFDLELAKEILKEDKDEYEIELTITHPNITINDIGTEAFPDLLGAFSTKYNAGNTNRTTNLKLAASKVNGTVVGAGETFSYNKTVGERTVSAGYKNAAGYSGGEVVDMLGGGICQISSTLYDAVVYSNLEIVSRRNHAFLTSYTTAGRDATVVYGAIDFKFKNTRKYPILIKMSVQGGFAKAEIYGVKEEVEYEIDIETTILNYLTYTTIYKDDESLEPGVEKTSQGGMNGCKSITYKVKKVNGVEASREVLSTDTYNPMNRIVRRGTAVQIPTQEVTSSVVEEGNQQEIETPEPPVENQNIITPPEQNVIPPESSTTINNVISNTND